ncbi:MULTISPECIES: DUF6049 family protein [unclassified Leucobacter]|uniref:DUF6049 family protein n=1 Tax=unclassified Leucobacter TaxID=2621730 RepID=UPI00165E33D9|nr:MULTISPECIES: DUF6049 family protein [unclassified Leucobacter]MBC9936273.1 hypothetical protein [Leucobacter sp. cx-87]
MLERGPLGTPSGAPAARRARSRVGAGVLAVALALGTVAFGTFALGNATPPAGAVGQSAQHTATRAAEVAKTQPSPVLTLAPVRPALLSNDESAEFELWLENPGDTELAASRVELALDPIRITGEAGLDAEFPIETALTLLEAETPTVPAGEGRLVSLAVPRAEWPLTTASDAGVYRVSAQIVPDADSDTPELSTTAPIVWRGAGGLTRVQLTTIVPMILPESIPSLPRRGQLDELMGPGSQLDELLNTAEQRGATLAIDPRVVAGVRVYGESASASAQSFVERLGLTSASTFALQFADADPSAQAALGFSRMLAPEGLSFATRFGTFAGQDPAETPAEPSPTDGPPDEPAPDPEPIGVPSLAELTTVATTLPGTAWPASDSLTPKVLDLLGRNGYSRVIASGENVSVAGGAARGTLNGVEYLVSDASLDAAARTALTAENETGHRSGVARTSALLVLRAQAGDPGTVVALDRAATPESPYAVDLVNTLSALPWVEPVAPGELPEGAVTLTPAAEAASPERIAALGEAVAREPQVLDYSRVLVAPEYLIDLQRVRLLQLFSARYTTPDANFASAAQRAAERDAETLNGVRVVTSTHTQLVGTTSRVPIQVRNTLPFDALLVAEVVPTNAALVVTGEDLKPALIPSESSTNILVPVRTRVSSGESGLEVELTAASGGEVVTSGLLAISIRSSWETVALGSLAVLTAAFFGFGIWRSIRRRSRTSAEDPGIVEP